MVVEQSILRSVDSECPGRVIEPRNWSRGSLRLGSSGGRVAAPQRPGADDPAGVEEQGIGTGGGSPGTWEARSFPSERSRLGDSDAKSKSPWPLDAARTIAGSEPFVRGWYRQTKENEVRREERSGVGAFHSTVEAGEFFLKETLWRKGNAVGWNR